MGALLQRDQEVEGGLLGALREVCVVDGMGRRGQKDTCGRRVQWGQVGGTDRGGQEVYSPHREMKRDPLEGCHPVGLVTMETFCAIPSGMVATSHTWLWSAGKWLA